jgi:hypothetical protein
LTDSRLTSIFASATMPLTLTPPPAVILVEAEPDLIRVRTMVPPGRPCTSHHHPGASSTERRCRSSIRRNRHRRGPGPGNRRGPLPESPQRRHTWQRLRLQRASFPPNLGIQYGRRPVKPPPIPIKSRSRLSCSPQATTTPVTHPLLLELILSFRVTGNTVRHIARSRRAVPCGRRLDARTVRPT